MQTFDFVKIVKSLSSLTVQQCNKLIIAVNESKKQKTILVNSENVSAIDPVCPHCHNKHIVRFGKVSGLQRYRCRSCFKTFNILTGTPLAHLRHKEVWQDFAQALIEGNSIRKSAQNCGVHPNTTFRWRHRFLRLPADMQGQMLTSIIEADETYFLKSLKGQRIMSRKSRKRGGKAVKPGLSDEQACVLVVRDRAGHTLTKVMENFNSDALEKVIKPVLSQEVLLCTDGLPVYQAFARKTKIAHQPLNIKAGVRVIDKVLHIQNVNAFDSRLHQWMQRFHGVATRYLHNYMGWFRMLDALGENINPQNFISGATGITYQQLTLT